MKEAMNGEMVEWIEEGMILSYCDTKEKNLGGIDGEIDQWME